MATIYDYWCGYCGCEAEVCGKPTLTYMAYLETIYCRDCKELYDVALARRVEDGDDGGIDHPPNDACDPVIESLRQQMDQELEDAEDAQRPTDDHLLDEIHAVILRRTAMGERDGFRRVQPRCPKSEKHSWEPWQYPGGLCPKCGETIERGEKTGSVD